MPGRLRWIFVGDRDKTEADDMDHGSCVLSKAVSPMFGTAKNANITIVKLPPGFYAVGPSSMNRKVTEDGFLAGLVKILDDVRQNRLQGKAVLNISLGCKYKVLETQFTYEYLLMYVEQFRIGNTKESFYRS